MASFERVLSGRPARHSGEAWQAQPGGWRAQAGRQPAQETPADPLADPVVRAALAEAVRVAEERGSFIGRQGAEQELAMVVAAAQAFAHKLETAVPRDVEMLARTVAELSVLIARRILAAELRHDASVLIAAIEAGLRQVAGASMIHVELHPMAVDAVEAVWVARHGTRHRGFSWSFTGDPTLPADGCRIRTEHGLVEAGFEDQLSEVAAALDLAIPGYLGAALGPTAAAIEPKEPSLADAANAVQAPETAAPAGDAPSLPGAGADLSDDLDLEALATLGLDGLEDFEGLGGLDLGSGGTGEAGA
jgi:flagellar biosynthesis/type III secretory pathway protein FliH